MALFPIEISYREVYDDLELIFDMREYKYTKLIIGILFLGGLIFSYFSFGTSDFFSVFTLIIVFLLVGFLAGQEMVYDKYENLHYSALEDDARKRREKDKKISNEVHEHMKEYEKENPNV